MLEFNFHPFPEIETSRFILRQAIESDLEELYFFRTDPETRIYIDKEPEKDRDAVLKWLRGIHQSWLSNEAILWGIQEKGKEKLIGNLGFWNIQAVHHRAELGYVLHPNHHRKGIMHECLSAIIRYGFDVMQLHSIEANINPANEASRRLLLKNNFVKEAYFKENWYFQGKFGDSEIYSLLRHQV